MNESGERANWRALLNPYFLQVFGICLFGWTLANMDQAFFGYAIPPIKLDFAIGDQQIGYILSASFLAAAFFIVVAGLLTDRYGRRVMFTVFLALSALMVGLFSLAQTLSMLIFLRLVGWCFCSGMVPIVNSYVVETSPARFRGFNAGILQIGYPLGWFIGGLLAVELMGNAEIGRVVGGFWEWLGVMPAETVQGETGSWRLLFMVAFLVIPISLLLYRYLPESKRFLEEKKAQDAAPEKGMRARERIALLLSRKYIRRVSLGWIASMTFGGAYAGTAFFFPTFFHEVRGHTLQEANLIVGISYGIGALGYVASSAVGEFLTTRRNTIAIWVFTAIPIAAGVFWLDWGLGADIALMAAMTFFFYGTIAVLQTYLAEVFPTRVRATAVAFVAGVGINLGFAIYPLVVGALVGRIGWQWAFTVTVIPSLLLTGLSTLMQVNVRSGERLEDISE